jgi:Holliday junction resolvase RusA-like endonuclease
MSIKTKFIDVDVQKIHDNINRRDAETISDIVYDALNELGYIDDDNLMSWSWNLEVSVEVQDNDS